MQSNKLKIETQVQNVENVYLELDLPYYCNNENVYFKVISETKALRVTTTNNYGCTSIIIVDPSHGHTANEIARGLPISAHEYYVVANGIISEAKDALYQDNEPDENVQIDEILYDQR